MELAISNQTLSNLIGDIYQGSMTGEWDGVLNQIMEYTKANKAFFFLTQLEPQESFLMEYKANFESPVEALTQYQIRAMEDPGLEYTRFMAEGDVLNMNKHMDVASYKDTSFYQEIYKPLKVFYALAGLLCRDNQHESLLVVNRDEDASEFSKQDENLFKLITPHFSQAMHIYKELRLYKNYSNISKSILDQQDKSILVCDASGTVVLHNDHATKSLHATSVISLKQNKLELQDKTYQRRLDYFINQCASLAYLDIGTQETLVIEQLNRENILITVSPLINQNAFNDIDVPCCLVTIKLKHQINWQLVKQEFELTPKELQLVKAIHDKKKLNDLTKEFKKKYNTLRTHLQSVFKKSQVNSQTELLIKLNLFN